MVKKECLEYIVSYTSNGADYSVKLIDALPAQLKIIRELFPEYFDKKEPNK